jgi:hypothetical protein
MADQPLDAQRLLDMSSDELDELFRSVSDPGPIPAGEAVGTVLVSPGSELSDIAARVAHHVAWQGKVFDPATGELVNEVGPLGTHAVKAKVYVDTSWFDGRPAIILDYSKTSLVAHWIRDEIRQVAPGLYLGLVFWDKDRILDFALQFPPAATSDPSPDPSQNA